MTLLEDVPTPTSTNELREAVVVRNVLAKRAAGTRTRAWKELRQRYGLDPLDPQFAVFLSEWRDAAADGRGQLAHLLLAMRDPTVLVLGTRWLFPRLGVPGTALRVQDVEAFIGALKADHPEVRGWSAASIANIATHYLTTLRDFGTARGSVRKLTAPFVASPAALRFAVRALKLAGLSDAAIVEDGLFRLLGLGLRDVVREFAALNAHDLLRFHSQGGVVRLEVPPVAQAGER